MSTCCSEKNVKSITTAIEDVDSCDESSMIKVDTKFITCPACNNRCAAVPYQTVLLHILKPWLANIKEQRYYFCRSKNCDSVYIGVDDLVLSTSQMRTKVGLKDASNSSLACYCFGVTKGDAILNPSVKSFVVEQTKKGVCICSTHNPSGKCCLKDFPS